MCRTIAVALALSCGVMAAVKIEKTNYQGWPNSYRISNGEVEVIVTSDIGPRIMRYAFPGGQNVFKEFAEGLGKSGEEKWQLRGGHRIWFAPEDAVKRTRPTTARCTFPLKATCSKLPSLSSRSPDSRSKLP
jgi:hypothetical protein